MPASRKAFDAEASVRGACALAEKMDLQGWGSCFTDTGTFTDQSIRVTYEGSELDYPVRLYGEAFPDMHRELYDLWTMDDDTVIVRVAFKGTHAGPLATPFGDRSRHRQRADAPCGDTFELERGKIKRFDCYPEESLILTQEVIPNLAAAVEHLNAGGEASPKYTWDGAPHRRSVQ